MKHQPTLENSFVKLERMSPKSLSLFEEIFDKDIWKWYSVDINNFSDFLKMYQPHFKNMEKGLSYIYLIRDAQSGEVAGSSRYIDVDARNRSLEIGSTWIVPKWQRTYMNTATKLLMLENAFEHLEVNRVSLQTDFRNKQSIKAIERIGAIFEGRLRKHRVCEDGSIRDSVVYSIVADEWPKIKDNLASALKTR